MENPSRLGNILPMTNVKAVKLSPAACVICTLFWVGIGVLIGYFAKKHGWI